MLESIIGKCLQKRSADRYQSADQLLAELESIEAAPDNRPIDWSPPLPEADKLLRDLFQNVSRSERYYARARKSTPSVLIPCALLILSWAGLTAYQQYNVLTNDEKTYAKTKIRLDATDSQAIKKNAITHYIVEGTYEKILDLRNATSDSFDEGTIDDVKDAGVSRIILSQTHMDDGFLMHLSGMSSLRALNVDDTNVTAYGIASLAALPHLEDLALGATKIDREYLKALATIKSLKIIRFFHCDRIDGEGLAELARLPQLRTIQMKDCRISSNLSALSSPSLVELKLYYCSFERNQAAAHPKAGLKHFGAMPKLRQLTLDACDISRSELIEFKAAHRQVQIEVLPPDGPPTGRDFLQD